MDKTKRRQIFLVLGFFLAGYLIAAPFICMTVVWPPDVWDGVPKKLADVITSDGHRLVVFQNWNGHQEMGEYVGYSTYFTHVDPHGHEEYYLINLKDRKRWEVEYRLTEDKTLFEFYPGGEEQRSYYFRPKPIMIYGPPEEVE